MIVVMYDSGANGFRSSFTVMLYAGARSADVFGGMRCVTPNPGPDSDSKEVNV